MPERHLFGSPLRWGLIGFILALLVSAAVLLTATAGHAQTTPPTGCTGLHDLGVIRDGTGHCTYYLKVNPDGSMNMVPVGSGGTAVVVASGQPAYGVAPNGQVGGSCLLFRSQGSNLYGLTGELGVAGHIMVFDLAATGGTPANGAYTYASGLRLSIVVTSPGQWSSIYPIGAPGVFVNGIVVCASSSSTPGQLTATSTGTSFWVQAP